MKASHPQMPTALFHQSNNRSASWFSQLLAADLTYIWMKGIKVVLSLLIITILLGLTGGVFRILISLQNLLSHPIEHILRQLIIDTLIILALVEVFKTTLTYFSEGRVKVTFIVDTILVVMLTEIIATWFSEAAPSQWVTLGGILVVLALVRVVAVQWSPTKPELNSDMTASV